MTSEFFSSSDGRKSFIFRSLIQLMVKILNIHVLEKFKGEISNKKHFQVENWIFEKFHRWNFWKTRFLKASQSSPCADQKWKTFNRQNSQNQQKCPYFRLIFSGRAYFWDSRKKVSRADVVVRAKILFQSVPDLTGTLTVRRRKFTGKFVFEENFNF